jgi:hypothetical protein
VDCSLCSLEEREAGQALNFLEEREVAARDRCFQLILGRCCVNESVYVVLKGEHKPEMVGNSSPNSSCKKASSLRSS